MNSYFAKTADSIEMPFGAVGRVDAIDLDGVELPLRESAVCWENGAAQCNL